MAWIKFVTISKRSNSWASEYEFDKLITWCRPQGRLLDLEDSKDLGKGN